MENESKAVAEATKQVGTTEAGIFAAQVEKDLRNSITTLDESYKKALAEEKQKLDATISMAKSNLEATNELRDQVAKGNAKAIAAHESAKEMIDKVNAHSIRLYDKLVKAGSIAPDKSSFLQDLQNGVIITKDGRPLNLLGIAMSISLMSAQDYVVTEAPMVGPSQTKSYTDIMFKRNGKRYFETPRTVELRDSKTKSQFEVKKISAITVINTETKSVRTIPFVSAVAENISGFLSDTEAFKEITTNTDNVSILTIAPVANTVIVLTLTLRSRIASGLTTNALLNAIASFVAYGFNPILGLITAVTANSALDYLTGNKDSDAILTLPVSES